jgi:6-pyruvoyltetrahydropterin/6-carboxytetrahydropterin synthase
MSDVNLTGLFDQLEADNGGQCNTVNLPYIQPQQQMPLSINKFVSTKVIELGSCAFRQWRATHSHCCKLHGYRLIAKFWFGSTHLDEKNWCVDFGGLKGLKEKLQNMFDHTTCVAADDPLIDQFLLLNEAGALDIRIMPNGVGVERTAEYCFNTAAEYIKEKYGNRCWVEKVEVFEHEDNSAIYSRQDFGSLCNI